MSVAAGVTQVGAATGPRTPAVRVVTNSPIGPRAAHPSSGSTIVIAFIRPPTSLIRVFTPSGIPLVSESSSNSAGLSWR